MSLCYPEKLVYLPVLCSPALCLPYVGSTCHLFLDDLSSGMIIKILYRSPIVKQMTLPELSIFHQASLPYSLNETTE